MNDQQLLQLSLQRDGLAIHCKGWMNDEPLTHATLRHFLFFDDFETYFGQTLSGRKKRLTLPLYDAIRRLGHWQHPFIVLTGKTTSDDAFLAQLSRLALLWEQETTWQSLALDEDGAFYFIHDEEHVLSTLIEGEARRHGFTRADREALLPYLQTYGWQPSRPSPLKIALRLSEPETDDGQWTLETVIPEKDGSYWTPPKELRHAPFEQVLPEKWQSFAPFIRSQQHEMRQLASTLQIPGEHFYTESVDDETVHTFLKHDLALLRAFHYPIILPNWLRQLSEAKVNVQTEATLATKSVASFDDIIDFRWNFSLNGEDIDEETFSKIVASKRSFIQFQNEWFYVDTAMLAQIRALVARAEANDWTVKDLLLQQTPMQEALDEADALYDDPLVSFHWHHSLKEAMQSLREKDGIPAVPVPDNLHATLRPYQIEGYEWLAFMRSEQFGACLADDMGLGKTVQLITYLLYVHRNEKMPSIIICPTSVLGNWQEELTRFAPSLKTYIHYGASRKKGNALLEAIEQNETDVILTTYGVMTQDIDTFRPVEWTSITLDEAQNIKNRQTKQSRAIRTLRGVHHIALTGTPIENRLSELWSIFDFLNPGYFGSFQAFTNDFILPVERDDDDEKREQLRLKIEPFLLRRTKKDTNLALNLPKKHEERERCPLTTEQAALYEGFIQEAKDRMQHAPPFERKGIVLAMLNRLKQLCNHPALFLKETPTSADDLMRRSIKLQRIVERAAEIVARGEKALIFTQYIGMGELIQYVLKENYQIDVPFLTGQMRKEERDSLVQSFQNGEFPLFLLSLRAGGTGLNLTAANHVLHADRWWNPAVEEQATDRAYRIGQTQFVHVVKFMTIGTIEEKIDQMLREKSELSDDLIQPSEWITELSDEQIEELFSLDF